MTNYTYYRDSFIFQWLIETLWSFVSFSTQVRTRWSYSKIITAIGFFVLELIFKPYSRTVEISFKNHHYSLSLTYIGIYIGYSDASFRVSNAAVRETPNLAVIDASFGKVDLALSSEEILKADASNDYTLPYSVKLYSFCGRTKPPRGSHVNHEYWGKPESRKLVFLSLQQRM